MQLKIRGVDVLHVEPTRVALAANSLPASLGSEVVASELFMDTRRVGLLLDVLGDWV